MRLSSRAFVVGCAALLAACATATQRAYIAPSYDTIRSVTEEREGPQAAHVIFVENQSTVPITVFSISLRQCENTRPACGVTPMNVHVQPNSRVMVLTVEPRDPQRAFSYSFGFSWHADSSGTAALAALANNGDAEARVRLAAIQRADSERRSDVGYSELSRDDYRAIAGQAAALRALPDSLVLTPGQTASLDRVHLVLVDAKGQVLGRTHWVRWSVPGRGVFDFTPPNELRARRPGRAIIRFMLAEQAQAMLANRIPELELPVVVAYPVDPHAPVFDGRALDADSRTPLRCARVALEDSAQDVVSRGQTGEAGTFTLQAPRPGTYRVRVEMRGFAPSYGALQTAAADEDKQGEYLVRFTDQLLVPRQLYGSDFQDAQPATVRIGPVAPSTGKRGGRRAAAMPIVQGVTLGGSEAMPILGIISREPATTTWAQFVVDSAGQVDTTSILLPPELPASEKASIGAVLPRVHFTPAQDHDRPVCELLRMQVNFSPR